jgi:acetoin:2,6-dichlorophenolindophenol oxidoreductase subunit alpha
MGAGAAGKGGKRGTKVPKNDGAASSEASPTTVVEPKSAKPVPAWENPLVPNALLRELYQKMVETRLLGELTPRSGGKPKRLPAVWGQEACRVSVVQGLTAGDLVMDSCPGGLMDHLLSAKLPEVVRAFGAKTREGKGKKTADAKVATKQLAVYLEEAETRLLAGMGAALLLKRAEGRSVVVIFLKSREASNSVLRRALTFAAERELPAIVVALAKTGEGEGKSGMSKIAHRCGVPGIAVDGADAIALYRVAQESLERVRGGGGPVLIECLPFHVAGGKTVTADPVAQLREYLLQRGIGKTAWMDGMKKRFEARLAVAQS